MVDLYCALAGMAVLAISLFWLTLYATRRMPRRWCDLLAVGLVLAMFGYMMWLWDSVRMVRLLPFSNMIVLGNWFPLAGGILAALAWRRTPGPFWRRSLPVVALFATAGYSATEPLLGQPPDCGNAWDASQVCLQTAEATCSPACAATVLRHYGIDTDEQEMARLCLTREGTTWQGLYHGLKRKTAGTRYDVEVFECDFETLRAMYEGQPGPMILSVGLEAGAEVDSAYQTEWGWKPGVGHSIVLVEFLDPWGLEIADPAPDVGREQWTNEVFQILWRGYGLRLVERDRAARTTAHKKARRGIE